MPPAVKHALLDAVIDVARGTDGLAHFSAVGSHADRERPEERHNDYDFLFIYDDLTWARFRTLRARLDEVAVSLSVPEHAVYVEDRLGPIVPSAATPVVSAVQPLVFDAAGIRDYITVSPFVTLDWSRFPTLLGRRMSAFAPMGFPTVEQLLNARAGIRHYREMALERTVIALAPVEEHGRVGRRREPLAVTDEALLELYHAIVTRTMANALMVFAHEMVSVKGPALLERFLARFPGLVPHRDMAVRLIEEQARYRAGAAVRFDADAAQAAALALLADLESLCEQG